MAKVNGAMNQRLVAPKPVTPKPAAVKLKNPKAAALASPQSPSFTVAISADARSLNNKAIAQKAAAAPARGRAALVSYTNNIKRTGDKTIDPLLAGKNYWWNTGIGADGSNPAAAADHTLTYSFMAAGSSGNTTSFQALAATQQDVVRDALAYISSVADISFAEDAGGSGQIKLGSNDQTSKKSSGYAYYPNGGNGGEVYLANNAQNFKTASEWDRGGYTWFTIIHEVGHALGLKHPGNYNAGGGGTPPPYLSGANDNRMNSVMSYKNNLSAMHVVEDSGGGMTPSNVNPDTYQTLDILALQYLYGAPTATSSQQTYSFSDGQVFSRTLYNNNAASAIDLSGMASGSVVDLRGGHFSSIGIRDPYAATGYTKKEFLALKSGKKKLSQLTGLPTYSGANNLAIAKGSKIQTAIGGNGNDKLISGSEIGGTANLDGGSGDDAFFIASGNATISDSSGTNDSVYVVKKAGTVWAVSADHSTLTQTNSKTGATLASVSLSGIEHVGYWNGKTLKAAGKALFAPPTAAKMAAYANANATPKSVQTAQRVNVTA